MDARNYSVTETLRDGSLIEVRALRPTDRDQLLGAVDRMSEESVRRRFFAPKRSFSAREMDFYLNVDFVNHVALVAVLNVDGHPLIAGGGRYIVARDDVAEVAFGIDDTQQRRGIGGLLLRNLAAIGRESGLHEFIAEVLRGNEAMLSVFRKAGLEMTTKHEAGIVHVTLHWS